MLLKSHYIKYNKNITFAIFNLIVDKVIADGYHLPNAVNTEYKFFKTDHPFFTWNEYKNSTIIGAYNERFIKENNSNFSEISVEKFLGYDPFIVKDTFAKDDYIVLTDTKIVLIDFSLKTVYKVRNSGSRLLVYKNNNGHNDNITQCEFDNSGKVKWRYANEAEIMRYNMFKSPIHVNDIKPEIQNNSFQKDDYIVLTYTDIRLTNFTIDNCYKCAETSNSLSVYKDDVGIENGYTECTYDNNGLIKWREATPKEITRYDSLKFSFNTKDKSLKNTSVIQYAIDNYPKGTIFWSAGSLRDKQTSTGNFDFCPSPKYPDAIGNNPAGGLVYANGKWANIIELPFDVNASMEKDNERDMSDWCEETKKLNLPIKELRKAIDAAPFHIFALLQGKTGEEKAEFLYNGWNPPTPMIKTKLELWLEETKQLKLSFDDLCKRVMGSDYNTVFLKLRGKSGHEKTQILWDEWNQPIVSQKESTLSKLSSKAKELGFVKDSIFVDLVHNEQFTIANESFDQFGHDDVLYISVKKHKNLGNKTACIYKKGKWAEIVYKLEMKTDKKIVVYCRNIDEWNIASKILGRDKTTSSDIGFKEYGDCIWVNAPGKSHFYGKGKVHEDVPFDKWYESVVQDPNVKVSHSINDIQSIGRLDRGTPINAFGELTHPTNDIADFLQTFDPFLPDPPNATYRQERSAVYCQNKEEWEIASRILGRNCNIGFKDQGDCIAINSPGCSHMKGKRYDYRDIPFNEWYSSTITQNSISNSSKEEHNKKLNPYKENHFQQNEKELTNSEFQKSFTETRSSRSKDPDYEIIYLPED